MIERNQKNQQGRHHVPIPRNNYNPNLVIYRRDA